MKQIEMDHSINKSLPRKRRHPDLAQAERHDESSSRRRAGRGGALKLCSASSSRCSRSLRTLPPTGFVFERRTRKLVVRSSFVMLVFFSSYGFSCRTASLWTINHDRTLRYMVCCYYGQECAATSTLQQRPRRHALCAVTAYTKLQDSCWPTQSPG